MARRRLEGNEGSEQFVQWQCRLCVESSWSFRLVVTAAAMIVWEEVDKGVHAVSAVSSSAV